MWMNPIEITLNRHIDKTYLRADIRCKWTPISFRGEHFITTIFWIPDVCSLQFTIRVVENLLAIILIPMMVRAEEFVNLLWPEKSPGRWTNGKTKACTILWIIWTRNLTDSTRCHTSTSCWHSVILMTFELNIKCLWQYATTSNN